MVSTTQQQHPPSSQTPSHEQSHSASDQDPPWDGDKMFNIYIWDYCNKRGYLKTCQDLAEEAKLPVDPHPPIDAKQGLLYEWWSVFWVLFSAKSNNQGTDDAMVYINHLQRSQNLQGAIVGGGPARYPSVGVNGVPPTMPNQQQQPPGTMQGPNPGGVGGIGRGMPPGMFPPGPPAPGSLGAAGQGQSQAQAPPMHAMQPPQPMPNGVGPSHGPSGQHQPPHGQQQQGGGPGPGPGPGQQQPPGGMPHPQQHPTSGQSQNQSQGQNQQQSQQQQPQQHPQGQSSTQSQPSQPRQQGATPLGFPVGGPLPGPATQQQHGPGQQQPNGLPPPLHQQPPMMAGMSIGQRGPMPFGGVGRGGPPMGFPQASPTMAHAHPGNPNNPNAGNSPASGPQGQNPPLSQQQQPPMPYMPPGGMPFAMRPGGPGAGVMYPPQPPMPNGIMGSQNAGPTAAGTPGSAAASPHYAPAGGVGGSRTPTPTVVGGPGGPRGTGGSSLTQQSPRLANASVGAGRGAGAGSAPTGGSSASTGGGPGRGRGAKRNSVSPGDEAKNDNPSSSTNLEASPPDRKRQRRSPNGGPNAEASSSSSAGPSNGGPSGVAGSSNATPTGTPHQQAPNVPQGGYPPGMTAGHPNRAFGTPQMPGSMSPMMPHQMTQQLAQMRNGGPYSSGLQAMHKIPQTPGMPGSPSTAAPASQPQQPQAGKPPGSTMMPPPSTLTTNGMKPVGQAKVDGKSDGNQGAAASASNPSPATPVPGAPSPSHTTVAGTPGSRPGTASSNHVASTPTMASSTPAPQSQPTQPPVTNPPSSTPIPGANGTGTGAPTFNSMNATAPGSGGSGNMPGVTDFDFGQLGDMGMGMGDFSSIFRDDFERDFGAWFTSNAGGDDPLDPLR